MSILKNLRFKTMLENVMKSNDPEEVHDLFTEFLGEDFETSGRIKYKSADVEYCVGYAADGREIIFALVLRDKQDQQYDEPVASLRLRLKRDAMKHLHKDVKSMIALIS